MVVDEELKMMCDICHEGGQVLGPFLKPMTHLIHTEYLLAGRTHADVREVLRDTMYAATVTGSPVENACRLIKRYEAEGRGYYGAALALFGREPDGEPVVDSPILIRTADVDTHGRLKVTAGATLVRDSDAAYEVAETHAKAGGILSAFGLVPAAPVPDVGLAELAADEDVLIALGARNARLSTFWLTDQAGSPPDPRLRGKRVLVLDGEDDFVNMLRHVLGVLGLESEVVRHEAIDDTVLDSLTAYDLVIVGPGPGDPRDGDDPKMQRIRAAVDRLLANRATVPRGVPRSPDAVPPARHRPALQGHRVPGHPVTRRDRRPRRARGLLQHLRRAGLGQARPDDALPSGVSVEADAVSGDIHVLTGPHYKGIQFHAESILTQHGYDLIHAILQELLGEAPQLLSRVVSYSYRSRATNLGPVTSTR